jgi:signal transduction histidine kinase
MFILRGRVHSRRLVALTIFVFAVLAAFNLGSWYLYHRERATLEDLLRLRLITAARLVSVRLSDLELRFERERSVYYLVHDVFREVQEAEPDLSAIFLLDEADEVLAAYPQGGIEERTRYPFADLDAAQITAAREGLFVATPPKSQESLFFMNAYGSVRDLLGNKFVVGLKADVGYQETIDSTRFAILAANAVSGIAVLVFAFVYYRAGRRMAREEEATFRREKLATLGQLASGVAHEIRNPLGVMKQAVFLLRKHRNSPDKTTEWLGYMETAIERMNHLVEDVLGYARGGPLDIKEANLAPILDRALHLVEHKLRTSKIEVERDYQSRSTVPFDQGRIEQVAVNLLLNAIEAMPNGGHITMRTLEDGAWVGFEVEDDGPGIPADELPHIMEPFHTRKESGTGLGLTIVEHIVESHGGRVTVSTRPGRGSRFTIRLPRSRLGGGSASKASDQE